MERQIVERLIGSAEVEAALKGLVSEMSVEQTTVEGGEKWQNILDAVVSACGSTNGVGESFELRKGSSKGDALASEVEDVEGASHGDRQNGDGQHYQ